MATRSPLSLKAQALALLARREHSRQELRRKLMVQARRRLDAGQPLLAEAGTDSDGLAAAQAEAATADPWAEDAWADAFLAGPACDDEAASPHAADRAELQARMGEAVDAVLDWLAGHRYLDEARFVECRLNSRAAGHGLRRIRQELSRHGLSLAPEQADELRHTELERARALWRRRFGDAPATDPRERARQMRFLAARGFAGDVVRRVVGGADDEAGA